MKGTIEALALDVEGTLLSDAMSQIARPGLRAFLDVCGANFTRIVAYTALQEALFSQIACMLVNEGSAPGWFEQVEHVTREGPHKDLRFIHGADAERTVLVDDHEGYVHPDQRRQWIPVRRFESPFPDDDNELARVGCVLLGLAVPPADRSRPVIAKRLNRRKAAALPFRRGARGIEFLLVTSVRTGEWIVPKGNIDPGYSPADAAVVEAREEGGVVGTTADEPIAEFEIVSRARPVTMMVFPLRVATVLETWDESEVRRRQWCSLERALGLLGREWMRSALRLAAESLTGEPPQ